MVLINFHCNADCEQRQYCYHPTLAMLERCMKRVLLYLWNFWPPFWGAGIKIDVISPDYKYVRTRLKRRPWTKNIVSTQFGGSIYAMTDPIYMVMLLMLLGRDYIVWDKAANIRFRKPGRT